ncbi:MAG: PHP domain-containing protein [Deinococcales bacterium]
MTKKDALKALAFTASLIEYLGDNERAKAYQTAERALDSVTSDWEALCERGFTGVRGIGVQLAAHLAEFHATGKFPPLEELKTQISSSILELFRVRGLGAKKIRTLADSGIESLADLIKAAEENRLAALKGFGAASQKTILENALFAQKSAERHTRNHAELVFSRLGQRLSGVAKLEAAGSLRRGLETIGDLDVIATGDKTSILERLGNPNPDPNHPHLYHFVSEGMTVQFCHVEPEFLGAAQLIMTGSKPLLQELRSASELELSSRGFLKGQNRLATPSEPEAWQLLGRSMPPPEWREAEHIGRKLPLALLELPQIQGMLHVHSNYSDGSHSLREMALAARKLGMQYLGICDHSRSAFYAGGLSVQKVQQQWEEIDALNRENLGIVLLKGIESDILANGDLDYPDEILAGFDFVVSSIHSQFTLSQSAQTERLIRAVQNPLTTILGHPTGRLLLRRPGYAFDVAAVLEAAHQAGTIIEINANPNRLDLDWRIVLEHPQNLYAVNTDAHSTAGLLDLPHGIAIARKGGVTLERCVNTWDVSQFLQFARQKRGK